MRHTLLRRSLLVTAAAALCVVAGQAAPVFAQGQIIIVNTDGPGEGFNDPTPAAPVGGNNGTTLGQQRLNVFEYAANIWEAKLQPKTDIYVQSSFDPLGTNVLGSAGTTFIFRNSPGVEYADTWYHSALADKLAGAELNPGFTDIRARFSSQFVFYLGYDNNEGALVDLLPVVLHELGHGLGFANFVDETTGALFSGGKDIYSEYTQDVTTGQRWNDMATNAERAASAINIRRVSWDGVHVNASVPDVLAYGVPTFVSSIGSFAVGAASFGPALTPAGVSGNIVLGLDAVGTPGDACEPLANPAAVAGNIALVDRGTCAFVIKVKNAQNAGAIAVLVADNVLDEPPAGLGGTDPTITIPSVRVSLPTGNALKAALAGGAVTGTLSLDLSIRAGTDDTKSLALLATFNPVRLGSSISHYDGIASPNQLMEPAINSDLTNEVEPPVDLTLPLMTDIGWFSDQDGVPDGRDECLGSDIAATVVIESCDSRVPNTIFTTGCSISDLVAQCAVGAADHGAYASCVAQTTTALRKAEAITGRQQGAIQACAAQSSIGK